MSDQGAFPLTLLPDDEPVLSPADQLAAAVASVTAGAVEITEDPKTSYGRTWVLDPINGGFKKRSSGEPLVTSDIGALEQWSIIALYSVRYGHRVFSDAFGVEGGSEVTGKLATAARNLELKAAMERALLQYDRVTAVEGLDPQYDPILHVINVGRFTLITDDKDRVVLANIQVQET